jgi:DNA (cytosine-5)-methyltransferase 1
VSLLPAEFAAQYDGTWGDYAAAIARWEALTRPAPPPTQPSKKGTPQLSPAFAEWMMGLPAGWITDVPGVTRNEALRLAGNGVVPTQAAAALRIMLNRAEAAA